MSILFEVKKTTTVFFLMDIETKIQHQFPKIVLKFSGLTTLKYQPYSSLEFQTDSSTHLLLPPQNGGGNYILVSGEQNYTSTRPEHSTHGRPTSYTAQMHLHQALSQPCYLICWDHLFNTECMSACIFSPLSCKEDITHSPLHLARFLPMPLTATYQIPTMWYVVSLHVLLQACASLQVFYPHVCQ